MAAARRTWPKEIGTVALAALLDLSRQRINQLTEQNVFAKTASGTYPCPGTVHAYVKFLKDDAKRSSTAAADGRVRDARAREIELRIAEREHTLIETEEAAAVLDEIVGIVRVECGGLGARVSRDLELRRRIENEVNAIFTRVADRLADRASALRSSGAVAEAGSEDDA